MRSGSRSGVLLWVLLVIGVAGAASAWAGEPLSLDRLKVQRKEVFEFTEKPRVTREGDRITITFASRDFCDATVAIENDQGKIVRHLASGVLGKNAPAPFQKDSLKQTIVWDGKDEIGRYIADKESHTVRVSLGLKAQMERTLFWSPCKRETRSILDMAAQPEGVYTFDRGTYSFVRLYDHDGKFVRQVYPPPADKLKDFQGLDWREFPPDGAKYPFKLGHDLSTFLPVTAGACPQITDMVAGNGRIYLIGSRLTRLGADGSTGGRPVNGPLLALPFGKEAAAKPVEQWVYKHGNDNLLGDIYLPHSAALSPDGKWLYLTAYGRYAGYLEPGKCFLHGVMRVAPDGDKPPGLFAGVMEEKGTGTDNAHFQVPSSVDCDAQGRVYVTDYINNRIQVFSPDAKHLKTIPIENPARVLVDRPTGEIYVLCQQVMNFIQHHYCAPYTVKDHLTHLGPFEDPKVIAAYPLPNWPQHGGIYPPVTMTVDGYGKDRRIWMVSYTSPRSGWNTEDALVNVRILSEQGRKLTPVFDFAQQATKDLVRARYIRHARQHLYVHPVTGMLYVGEHTIPTVVACKSFYEIIKIDPNTGKIKLEQMPTNAEDMGFDWEGRAYLRGHDWIARFDPATWREVPFDYGEHRMVYHDDGGAKPHKAISAAVLPGCMGGTFHLGGFGVAPDGTTVASCINPNDPAMKKLMKEKNVASAGGGSPYTPQIYPGRNPGGFETHIFDIHGKLVKDDVAPGISVSNFVQIDRDRNVYLLAASTPYLDGKRYFNGRGCTLMKFAPGKLKCLTPGGIIPLSEALRPKRPMDMTRPGIWVEGAEWLFGPVGADGHYGSGGRCDCHVNGRFALDYFARSFAPEVDRFRVVVLDTNGNVILRIGRYGNVEDGVPLVREGGPPNPRSMGGDEVGIMDVMNLAVHTDRRLLLSDTGNQCIRSVKLGYHTDEKIALKDVPDQGGK